MRLSQSQKSIISNTLREHFGQNSRIMLFGSRVDDQAKGGDIDLYIEPEPMQPDQLVEARLKALVALHRQLGEQKIDLVINRKTATQLPIYQIAQQTGVPL